VPIDDRRPQAGVGSRRSKKSRSHLKPKEEFVATGPSYSEGKKCTICSTPVANINKSGRCKKHTKSVVRAARKPDQQTPPRSLRSVQKPELDVPAEAQKSFTGMPAFEDVPIGWTVGFLKFLRDQSVAVDGIGATAA
jgi:hypothetical protein